MRKERYGAEGIETAEERKDEEGKQKEGMKRKEGERG